MTLPNTLSPPSPVMAHCMITSLLSTYPNGRPCVSVCSPCTHKQAYKSTVPLKQKPSSASSFYPVGCCARWSEQVKVHNATGRQDMTIKTRLQRVMTALPSPPQPPTSPSSSTSSSSSPVRTSKSTRGQGHSSRSHHPPPPSTQSSTTQGGHNR